MDENTLDSNLSKLFTESRWHKDKIDDFVLEDSISSLQDFIGICEESLKADKALAEFLKTHTFADEELFIADMKSELEAMKVEEENARIGV